LVQASKTRLRGAAKTRVSTISRSVGVVICNVPVSFTVFVIGDLLLWLRASTFFLVGLQLVEQGIEALEAALQRPAVALQPFGGFRERLGLDPAGPPLRVAAARNQAGALQDLEVRLFR